MRGGHIPGSKSVPFDAVLSEGKAGLKSPAEIKSVFEGTPVSYLFTGLFFFPYYSSLVPNISCTVGSLPLRVGLMMSEAGIQLDSAKPIVASCGSGMTACVLALALDQIGQPLVRSCTDLPFRFRFVPSLATEMLQQSPPHSDR
jgi:thiosulfate/3-mercaptopyruvate sulfurtransferase